MSEKRSSLQSKLVDTVREKLPEIATTINGKALVLPNLARIQEVTGLERTNFYRYPGGFEQSLYDASGLRMLARDVIILGQPEDAQPYDAEFVQQSIGNLEVERLAAQADTLSPQHRQELIARLAVNE